MRNIEEKNTLVLIASSKADRYSYRAIELLQEYQVPVVAIGRRPGAINGLNFLTGQPFVEGIDTLTLYLNPFNQKGFYDYIVSLKPNRVIFNPGTENLELQELLDNHSIYWEESCTLVLLRTNQF